MLRPIQKLNQRFTVAQLKARSNRIARRLNSITQAKFKYDVIDDGLSDTQKKTIKAKLEKVSGLK